MIYNFSKEEKITICKLYKNDIILSEIGQKFKCSWQTIARLLIKELGKEEYKRIAKIHSQENSRKNIIKAYKSFSTSS